MPPIIHSFILLPGATPLFGYKSEASSVPVFLSSLHCTDEDHSLLDDCTHTQLGLAVCDENSGLAGAKCLGKDLIYDQWYLLILQSPSPLRHIH